MVRFPFIPREVKFFDLFEKSAQNMVATAKGLKKLIDDCGNIEVAVAQITELEHVGDTITH